ncbi:hypothetical protein B0T25DRAFT_522845 [Lasiosphaeria hispida]|uniref:Cytoskeleton-associated protein n=1 Tax=Lasiosphaeria hispida TaxID=260671 RepID=A0AAJ0H6P1_9PEZI|nr:hypothetical protein B0T25DRAFT_522845 [Lasiosphaeria hispida]
MSWLNTLIRDDRVIFGGLGMSAVGMVVMIRLLLEKWREESEIKPVQPKTQYITQDTEDSLKQGTLDTLLGHYNYAIRETAAKIVCDRAVNDGTTIELLLWGITRNDYDERMKNLRALAVITDPQSLPLLHTWKAYAALVRSLELSIDPEQEVLDDEHWDEYPMRDMTEKLGLMFISQLISRYDVEKLIKAKFVEKWLAKQNWGATTDERQENFMKYLQHKNNRIADIISRIKNTRSGSEALKKSGLLDESFGPSDESEEDNSHLVVADQFNMFLRVNMGEMREEDTTRLLARTLQNLGDQRLRQRNREAMVLNDGSRPLNRDDIIQRETE